MFAVRHNGSANTDPQLQEAAPPQGLRSGCLRRYTSNSCKPSLASARRLFEKECLVALAALTRKTGWKKSREFVVRQQGGLFFAGKLTVYLNANRLVASLDAKPMALDPILWEILDLPENNQMPLSFRAMGAFTCHALTMAETDLEYNELSPNAVALAFMEFIEKAASQAHESLRSRSFTEQLLAHPNQVDGGAYAITLVASQINDGQYRQAAELAQGYASGRLSSRLQMISLNKSFHEHALAWLATKTQ